MIPVCSSIELLSDSNTITTLSSTPVLFHEISEMGNRLAAVRKDVDDVRLDLHVKNGEERKCRQKRKGHNNCFMLQENEGGYLL